MALVVVAPPAVAASSGLNVYVGYMDTHSGSPTSSQPSPWPQGQSNFIGSSCSSWPTGYCWDAGAIMLQNPGSTNVTGVHVVVDVGSHSPYDLWGSNLTVPARSYLVLTETGSINSGDFDGSDNSPNSYNGGNFSSCANSGAIPDVRVTVGGATTDNFDNGQVLNTGGVDAGHCLNGTWLSGRMDESVPWTLISGTPATAPSAPTNLTATGGNGTVSLSWSAPSSNGGSAITGYNVYRATSSGAETLYFSGVTGTTVTDNTVTNGTTYYYEVTAVNTVGESGASNEAFATAGAVPTAPQNLLATGGDASVALSWNAPASDGGLGIASYNVYRGTRSRHETLYATGVTGSPYTDAGVTNGTTYYYEVTAVNSAGESPASNESSATPTAPPPTTTTSTSTTTTTVPPTTTTSTTSTTVPPTTTSTSTTTTIVPPTTTTSTTSTTVPPTTTTTTSSTTTTVPPTTTTTTVPPTTTTTTTVPPAPISSVARVASGTSGSTSSGATLTLNRSVPAGNSLIISMLLSSTSNQTGAVSVTDAAGNAYHVDQSSTDGSAGDRYLVLSSLQVKALASGATLSFSYPSSAEYHISVEEFAGITAVDQHAGGTNTSASFSAGPVTTTAPSELLFGGVGAESGSTPSFGSGWTGLGNLAVGSDYEGDAYRIVSSTGSYSVTGTVGGQWMAGIVTYR